MLKTQILSHFNQHCFRLTNLTPVLESFLNLITDWYELECNDLLFGLEQSVKQAPGVFPGAYTPALKLEWCSRFSIFKYVLCLRTFMNEGMGTTHDLGAFSEFSPTFDRGSVGIKYVDHQLLSLSSFWMSNCVFGCSVRPYQGWTTLILFLIRDSLLELIEWTGLG